MKGLLHFFFFIIDRDSFNGRKNKKPLPFQEAGKGKTTVSPGLDIVIKRADEKSQSMFFLNDEKHSKGVRQ
jgi:hypothetical protein